MGLKNQGPFFFHFGFQNGDILNQSFFPPYFAELIMCRNSRLESEPGYRLQNKSAPFIL